MAIVTMPLSGLFGGVSQQSPIVRADNQVEAANNCSFTIAHGCSKRNPVEVVNQLSSLDLSGSFVHWISDENGDWYILMCTSETLSVYRASDGQKLNVANDTLQTYLTTTDPEKYFRALTVKNDTYIVNTTTTVSMTASTAAGSIAGEAQTLQDESLDSVPDGNIYEIVGHSSEEFDLYYAKKNNGKWYEWVKPGINDEIDPSTMPHRLTLIYDEVDPFGVRFEFNPVTWEKRKVGDEKSNKVPSFVGDKITGIFHTSGRLGLLSPDAVTLSETDEELNFFRTTVTNVLDTARIDRTVKKGVTSPFRWAKPLQTQVVLFTDDAQYFLTGNPVLTPATASLSYATSYQTSSGCEPTNSGANLYFSVSSGNSSTIREMFIQEQVISTDAIDATAHVPDYLPKDMRQMASHSNLNMVCCHSPEAPNKLWVYQYYYNGDSKVQSAWGQWSLNPGVAIQNLQVIDDYLYFVGTFTYTIDEGLGTTTTETFLFKVNLKTNDPGEYGNPFNEPICLDFLYKVGTTYDSGTNRTLMSSTFPVMAPEVREDLTLILGTGHAATGRMFEYNTVYTFQPHSSLFNFYVAGDWWDDGDVFLGAKYMQELELTKPYYKSGDEAMLNARVHLKAINIGFLDTAYFVSNVEVEGIDSIGGTFITALNNTYEARTLGSAYFNLNSPQLKTGSYALPVLGNARNTTIKLQNESYIGANWVSAEYEALVTSRTRRV